MKRHSAHDTVEGYDTPHSSPRGGGRPAAQRRPRPAFWGPVFHARCRSHEIFHRDRHAKPVRASASKSRMWLSKPETFTAADLQHYRDSGIHAVNMAIGLGGPDAFLTTLQYVAQWDSFLAHHSETLKRIDTASDIDAARAAGGSALLWDCRTPSISAAPTTSICFTLSACAFAVDLQRPQHDRQRVHRAP